MKQFLVFFFFSIICCFADYQEDLMYYLQPIEPEEPYFSGIEGVDKIYVINLDKAENRWSYMEKELKKFNLKAQRFSAINGWQLSNQKLKYFYNNCLYPSNQKFLKTPGMIGCFLSHLSILKDAYENAYEVIWIMEDDVKFLRDPKDILKIIFEEFSFFKQPWDVLYTDTGSRFQKEDGSMTYYNFETSAHKGLQRGLFSLQEKKEGSLIKSHYIQRIERRLGTYSLLLSRKGIEKILTYFYSNKMEYTYDIDINFYEDKLFFQTKEDLVSTLGAFGSTTSIKGDEIEESFLD